MKNRRRFFPNSIRFHTQTPRLAMRRKMLKIVLISLCIFSMSVTATTSSSLSSQNSDDETDSIQTNKKNETLSQSEIETDQQISTTIAPTESSVTESLKEDDENATTDEDMLEKPKETRLESNLSELISKKTPNEARIILQDLADQGDDESKLQLAIAYFYGNFGFKWEISFQYFNELAAKGKSLAHLYLGFMYAIGLGPAKANQGKALLHYTFAALSNDTYARMALGYRYWSGISVTTNCRYALSHYRKVAKKVEQSYTFSNNPSIQRIRIFDEIENPGSYSGTLDDDLIQYYQFLADKGDISAQVGLGQLLFQGVGGIKQNQYRAYHYFMMAAGSGNTNAMAFLGKMFLEGNQVVERNLEEAYKYFKMAADKENPIGQSGLGIMYLNGKYVKKNFKQALKYFSQAAMQGWVDGQLYLGIMYYNGFGVTKNYKAAIKYFTMAIHSGHIIGFYHLAEMYATGTGILPSCSTAVELFKSVCERGEWGALIMEAHNDYKDGQKSKAFMKYAVLSELGYEVAQSNAAFLLDQNEVPDLFPSDEIYNRAFMYWSRAASQGYPIARLKLGDYHYYGLGTKVDYEMAANQYRMASELQNNAQALFNLGYMYETGLGLKRDIYLAKRYYDLAAVTSADAQVPVALALTKLFFVYLYENFKTFNFKKFSFKSTIQRVIDYPIEEVLGEQWDIYVALFLGLLGLLIRYMQQVGRR
ncbi:Protein sel-1 -like protein 1 [Sarcoptes scabiei]|uniref:Protein sel-1 -like protein 1 n=1 Tax=Sarcoptes scabiei TaxID=52283 RepID=A0A834QYP5_SARSC|nr:Protein sel-1 -like protein 1 [Sarcoptes scabiei]